MSENTMQLVVPNAININSDVGPWSQKAAELDRKQTKQVAAVAFLNKLEQEAILRAQEPVLEKLNKDHSSVTKKLERAAKKLTGAVKVDEESKDLKAALLAWGLSTVKLSVALDKINYDERVIEVTKKVGSDSYSTLDTEIDIPFNDDMNKLADTRDGLEEKIRDVSNLMVDAQAKLKNRANLLADAQGALALKQMDNTEVEEVKAVYASVKSGITVEKLLGAGTKG